MRAELFAKDASSLVASSRFLYATGARGINLPNKASATSAPDLAPTAALRTLAKALTPGQMTEVCPHYSIKFNSAGANSAATLSRFEDFCQEAARLRVRQCLLVSGSGSRKFSTVELLQALKLPGSRPEIGVAFNPFYPDHTQRQRERERLCLKLGTGAVSSVWLQIGSDVSLLTEALEFIESVKRERQLPHLRLYGSVFLPSRKLLAQIKFRPWNGVFLSEGYLSSVEAAEVITRQLVTTYHAHGVELLLESSISKPEDWATAVRLCAPSPAGLATPQDLLLQKTPAAPAVSRQTFPARFPADSVPANPSDAAFVDPAASSSPAAALRCDAEAGGSEPPITKKPRQADMCV